jgi:Tfp pilus assembly protein PilF
MLYYSQNKVELAVNHFEQALRLSPENANVRHNLQAALGLLRRKQLTQ